jgi:hypothetical protein
MNKKIMTNFSERIFFSVVRKLGLLFALISLALIIILSVFSYQKISSRAMDTINTPMIELAQYQNPASLTHDKRPDLRGKNLPNNAQVIFNQKFETHIQRILANLQTLPSESFNQADTRFKIKIKTSVYSPVFQLAYVESLKNLTEQLNAGENQLDVDNFLHWFDQEFARQIEQQKRRNLTQIATARTDQITGFMALAMVGAALGFFIMFVMMLAMLRIEKNTRT